MFENTHDPQPVIFSVRLYRRLVSAYPAEFRREYGELMLQVFRDSCRRANMEGGSGALFALWVRTVTDYFITIIEEYTRGGTNMTREKFIKLSGWALVLGSIALFVGWLAESRPAYDRFNAASLPIDRYANIAAVPILVIGMLLISMGILGLMIRYGPEADRIGRSTLALGALSGLISAVGMAGMGGNESGPWWPMFFLGMTVQYLMLAIFGIICMQRQILPRWNGLPLLAGLWIPGYVLVTGLMEIGSNTWVETPEFVFYTLWFLTLAGIIGLGYLLQADSQPAPLAAGAA